MKGVTPVNVVGLSLVVQIALQSISLIKAVLQQLGGWCSVTVHIRVSAVLHSKILNLGSLLVPQYLSSTEHRRQVRHAAGRDICHLSFLRYVNCNLPVVMKTKCCSVLPQLQ